MNSTRYIGPILSAYELKKQYMSEAGVLHVLKGVNFHLQTGEFAFIVGRSGSGKSTLLHLLGGLDSPTAGKIMFEGEEITDMSESDLARVRNRRIGFVFQSYHLLPELTVYENVLLPQIIAGKRDEKWVKEVLKRVKLLSRQDHFPSELSGGEQQRTAIARALVNRPSLVLCDEPTGNLDAETAESVMSLITDLNEREGQAFMIVTHDEALAWRYPSVFRLTDGILLRENTQNINAERAQP
jgi:lipoprotein-releasing system ATP-binding protein